MHEPANIAGPFGIRVTEDGFHELDVEGKHGGEGFVGYQVLGEERLVMLFGFAWLSHRGRGIRSPADSARGGGHARAACRTG
jgi:hypothetical protein